MVITALIIGLALWVLWSLARMLNRGADGLGIPRWVAWMLVLLGRR